MFYLIENPNQFSLYINKRKIIYIFWSKVTHKQMIFTLFTDLEIPWEVMIL